MDAEMNTAWLLSVSHHNLIFRPTYEDRTEAEANSNYRVLIMKLIKIILTQKGGVLQKIH